VVGYRDGLALLQLNCVDSLMEFVAIHMKTESILAVHKESTTASGGKHYLCDCIISPDLSTFILKPNAMYVLNFCRGEYRNSMKILSCKENRSVVLIMWSCVQLKTCCFSEFFTYSDCVTAVCCCNNSNWQWLLT